MSPILEKIANTVLEVGTLWCLMRLGRRQGPRESTQAGCPIWELLWA